MFKTEGQDVKGKGLGKSFEPGVVFAHIYGAQVRTSKTGKKALEIILEGPAIPDFEGWAIDREDPEGEKYKGQTARVGASIYISDFNSDDVNKNEILNKIIVISDQLGLRKEIDNLSNNAKINSIEEWVEAAVDILKDQDAYFFLCGKEDEYNEKIIVRLSFPKYKFCSQDESKLPVFDKTNKWHFSPFVNKSVGGFEPKNNDFNV